MDRQLLEFYDIPSLDPVEWTESDASSALNDYASGDYDSMSAEQLLQLLHNDAPALKDLVGKNLDQFVLIKTVMDSISHQMNSHGYGSLNPTPADDIVRDLEHVTTTIDKIMDPVLENRKTIRQLHTALSTSEKDSAIFDMPSKLYDSCTAFNHADVIANYNKLRVARAMFANMYDKSLSTPQNLVRFKLFSVCSQQCDEIIEPYKERVWNTLDSVGVDSNYMELIDILLTLGVEDNPIIVWLDRRCQDLQSRLDHLFSSHSHIITRKHRALLERTVGESQEPLYRRAAILSQQSLVQNNNLDLLENSDVFALWTAITTLIDDYMSTAASELSALWDVAYSFMSQQRQSQLSRGWNGTSSHHLSLSDTEKAAIRSDIKRLLDSVAQKIGAFFLDPCQLAVIDSVENKNLQRSLSYAFLPPGTSSLEAVWYCQKLLASLNRSFTELGNINISSSSTENVRSLLTSIRERIIGGLASLWVIDSAALPHIDLYNTYTDAHHGSTELPKIIENYNVAFLKGVRKLLVLDTEDDAENGVVSENVIIVTQPSTMIYNGLHIQFVSICTNTFQEMFDLLDDNAVSDDRSLAVEADADPIEALFTPGRIARDFSIENRATATDTRLLLTLGNLAELRSKIFPELSNKFSDIVSTITSPPLETAYDLAVSLEDKLFEAFISPKRKAISENIRDGVLSIKGLWEKTSKPVDVQGYAFESLLLFVLTHAQIKNFSREFRQRVFATLTVYVFQAILESVRNIERFSRNGVLQIVIDLTFINEVCKQFVTKESDSLLKRAVSAIQTTSNINVPTRGPDFEFVEQISTTA
ncbi:hypothetical protein CANCADRAFT_1233 [Tortispora caseinolytica NRRL Y-17796]|uniref:Exocyst complex component SEC5 n=1 Tax=Tortispora caseinolytica NRRL Y-17796 TaxID=767744 RepID=A0A1E4TLL3_9ASCO|nr:hypothetical protein CANCADRAFT_1233 [Tortispora caseinolytica NRRL Y-17796]